MSYLALRAIFICDGIFLHHVANVWSEIKQILVIFTQVDHNLNHLI